jgi:hypothetical protein
MKREGPGAPADPLVEASTNPWRAPVIVAHIPETGLSLDIEASAAQRKAMAETAGLRDISSAHAHVELMLERGGRVHVTGRLQARIGQTCVVTLDPIENDIDEAIDLVFAPPEQVKQLAELVDQAEDSEGNVPEPPESILGGFRPMSSISQSTPIHASLARCSSRSLRPTTPRIIHSRP